MSASLVASMSAMYCLLYQFNFSRLNTAADFDTFCHSNSFTNCSREKISCSFPGFHPKNAIKFISASGRYPASRKSSIDTSPCRLDSFCLFSFTRSERCAYVGLSQPNASYNAMCFGVELIHSSPRITCVISMR